VRNERSLCAHKVRKTCPMMSKAIRISLLQNTCSILLWFHDLDDGGGTAVSFRQNRQHGGKEAAEVVSAVLKLIATFRLLKPPLTLFLRVDGFCSRGRARCRPEIAGRARLKHLNQAGLRRKPVPTAKVKGIELFYKESGRGKEAIVFSHGLLMDHSMFEA